MVHPQRYLIFIIKMIVLYIDKDAQAVLGKSKRGKGKKFLDENTFQIQGSK